MVEKIVQQVLRGWCEEKDLNLFFKVVEKIFERFAGTFKSLQFSIIKISKIFLHLLHDAKEYCQKKGTQCT